MIVVDADGGDYAPHEVIKGVLEATEDCEIDIALVGRKVVLEKLLRRYAKDREFTIIEASQSIGYDERPVQAIRNNPDSSIVVGTKLVRDGIASAFVSAGNTGAVLSAAFVILGKIEYIQRPALCGIIHVSAARPLLLIDAGANVDCQPSYLIGFAQLGAAFARGFLDTDSPRVGLLNNGDEATKGNLLMRDSYQLLKKSNLNFIGNIESQDILTGKADIVVTDGFTGNIVLKTLEGVGDMFHQFEEVARSIGVDYQLQGAALVHYEKLTSIVRRMDYEECGGALLLGVRGNIIVAHGRSRSKAIKNAINLARRSVETVMIPPEECKLSV